jgi:hypothetical protein
MAIYGGGTSYKDRMGFEIRWLYPGKEIGSVQGTNITFLFRKRSGRPHSLQVDCAA